MTSEIPSKILVKTVLRSFSTFFFGAVCFATFASVVNSLNMEGFRCLWGVEDAAIQQNLSPKNSFPVDDYCRGCVLNRSMKPKSQ